LSDTSEVPRKISSPKKKDSPPPESPNSAAPQRSLTQTGDVSAAGVAEGGNTTTADVTSEVAPVAQAEKAPSESDTSSRERSKSIGGSTEYSSESSEPRKFRADLAEDDDRETAGDEPLVVHTSKAGKKKKKKKPVDIS